MPGAALIILIRSIGRNDFDPGRGRFRAFEIVNHSSKGRVWLAEGESDAGASLFFYSGVVRRAQAVPFTATRCGAFVTLPDRRQRVQT